MQDWVAEDKRVPEIIGTRPYVGNTSELVCHLVAQVPRRPLVVTMDNFFTSVKLFRKLVAMDVDAVGTIKRRSDVPARLLWPKAQKGRQVGTARCFRSSDFVLCVQAWQDSSAVHVLSTCHSGVTGTAEKIKEKPGVQLVQRMKRKGHEWEEQLVPCPPAISFYQDTMRGVDIADAVCYYIHYFRLV